MAKKKKRSKKGAGGKAVAANALSENDAPRMKEEIQALIASGRQKAALDRAKSFAKAAPGDAANTILLDAYTARIEGMLAKNMVREALSLLDLVVARFPAEEARLGRLRTRGAAVGGGVDDLVAPLSNADLAPEHRAEIEEAITRELTDLDALAKCGTLPEDHSLRIAAAQARDAFARVCSGPVSDEDIALPGLSRRSPLAPWKLLIRAIAHFYRGEDEACLDYISRLPATSAPARLAPLLRELCGKSPESKLWPMATTLCKEIRGNDSALRASLARCDEIFLHMSERNPFFPMKSAVVQCEKARPALVEPLKKHLGVILMGSGIDPAELKEVLGFAACKDAFFWRLAAKKSEQSEDTFFARSCWEEFRMHAIHEGWFAADSAVEAALLLHMASIEEPDEEDVEYDYFGDPLERVTLPFNEKSMQRHYRDQTKEMQADRRKFRKSAVMIHQDRDALFARACTLDPRPESFLKWHVGTNTDSEDPLLHWAEALPQDPEPLVLLAKDAQDRKALKKALDYLTQAEARNALDPHVRRMRFQITTAAAARHLKAGKAHLLRKDIAELEALDLARDGDHPALLAALSWAAASLEGAEEERDVCAERVTELLGGPVGSHLLLSGMAGTAKKLSQWPLAKVSAKAFRDEAGWIGAS
ncbi:MAG: hypothetical protein L3K26_05345, partial [Candidatus Hydrogenedentes bacterium]|nr:hypothetical protein [Candidatus Hydrogenedentota bacterium]